MKSSLALAAAMLVALGGAASAKSKTETISLDGHCDVLTLRIDKAAVAGTDACAQGFGAGFIGKVKGFGNAIVAGVQFPGEPGTQLVMRIQYPLVTGGAWDLSATTDGVTFSEVESGTYTVEGTAAKGARGTASIARDALKRSAVAPVD